VTVAVSLADKLDTLVSFFATDEKPTGSKDPFALRRAALSIISIILSNNLRLRLTALIGESGRTLATVPTVAAHIKAAAEIKGSPIEPRNVGMEAIDFFADRLKVQQREAGVRHDLIDAVFALGGEDDLVRLLARVHALQAFVTTEDGTNLLAGYKRAANILKKEGFAAAEGEGAQELSYTPEPAEKALIDALADAAPRAAQAVEDERFADAMAALATLRAPIDRFFEEVTVNADEADKRAARLALLARFRDAVHRVADFSRIEG
jgi:glycyl-tRNA synthetase beta chain